MARYAFIGAGNMAQAIMGGLLREVEASAITFYNRNEARREALAERLGCLAAENNAHAYSAAEIVILAVKPQQLDAVAAELRAAGALAAKPLVISILAGTELAKLQALLESDRIVRAMPNVAARVGASMTVLAAGEAVSEADRAAAAWIFEQVGQALWLSEPGLDQASAVNGCGPAFFFMAMEACADALVALGIPRPDAYTLTAQTMVGSGLLQLADGAHPGLLKDRVTSPAGTTIAGVLALEANGLRHAFAEAVTASYRRTLALSEEKH